MSNRKTIIKSINWTISIDLFIAFSLFLYITDFEFIGFFKFLKSLFINLSVGILGLFFVGNIVGRNLYRLKSKSKNYQIYHGILSIFIILIGGVLIGSCVGFLEEGLPNKRYKYDLIGELYDYFFKPIYWILIFGFIPTFISGVILGFVLKRLPIMDN